MSEAAVLHDLRCNDCGRFTNGVGATFAVIFDFGEMCPDHDHCRCADCSAKLGPARSNARPANGDTSPWEWAQSDMSPSPTSNNAGKEWASRG